MFKRNFYRQVADEQQRRGLLVGRRKPGAIRPRRLQQRAVRYYARQHERKWWRYLALLLVSVVAGLIWALFFSPLLKVKAFAMDGLRRLTADAVQSVVDAELRRRTLWVLPHDTYLAVHRRRIEAALQALPVVASAHVVIRFPGTLEVVIVERTVSVVWETQEERYEVDLTGRAVQPLEATSTDGGLPRIIDTSGAPVQLGDLVTSPELVNLAIEGAHGARGVEAVAFQVGVARDQLGMLTKAGWSATLTTRQRYELQRTALEAVLDKLSPEQFSRLDYIDVTVPTLPTYKLK